MGVLYRGNAGYGRCLKLNSFFDDFPAFGAAVWRGAEVVAARAALAGEALAATLEVKPVRRHWRDQNQNEPAGDCQVEIMYLPGVAGLGPATIKPFLCGSKAQAIPNRRGWHRLLQHYEMIPHTQRKYVKKSARSTSSRKPKNTPVRATRDKGASQFELRGPCPCRLIAHLGQWTGTQESITDPIGTNPDRRH
jgi:hypothetical protein